MPLISSLKKFQKRVSLQTEDYDHMKKLILPFLLFVPTLSFACPELSGTFACQADSKHPVSTIYTITMNGMDSSPIYHLETIELGNILGSYDLIPDDVARDIVDPAGVALQVSCSCNGDTALQSVSSQLGLDPIADQITQKFSLDQNGDLVIDTQLDLNGTSTDQPTQTCVRN